MRKNIFDRMSDSYDNFHLESTEIQTEKGSILVSPKLKLILGWSIFVFCCIMGYVMIRPSSSNGKALTQEEKAAVLEEDVSLDEEHETIVPYEKNADEELNAFIEEYFAALVACDNVALQDMVTDASEYTTNDLLKKKAEFITGYDNITVYTKVGLDEGSYVAFIVTNLSIVGVNSSPYDITTLYIVNGARGYLINNGILSLDAQEYMEKVKGDEDIQKIYRSVEKKNNDLKEKDKSLRDFFEIISRRNVEVESAADIPDVEENSSAEDNTTEETTTQESQDEDNAQGEEANQT